MATAALSMALHTLLPLTNDPILLTASAALLMVLHTLLQSCLSLSYTIHNSAAKWGNEGIRARQAQCLSERNNKYSSHLWSHAWYHSVKMKLQIVCNISCFCTKHCTGKKEKTELCEVMRVAEQFIILNWNYKYATMKIQFFVIFIFMHY